MMMKILGVLDDKTGIGVEAALEKSSNHTNILGMWFTPHGKHELS